MSYEMKKVHISATVAKGDKNRRKHDTITIISFLRHTGHGARIGPARVSSSKVIQGLTWRLKRYSSVVFSHPRKRQDEKSKQRIDHKQQKQCAYKIHEIMSNCTATKRQEEYRYIAFLLITKLVKI